MPLQQKQEDISCFDTYVNTSVVPKEPNTKQVNQKVGDSRNNEIMPERQFFRRQHGVSMNPQKAKKDRRMSSHLTTFGHRWHLLVL